MTNTELSNHNCTPNRALKSLIEDFFQQPTSRTHIEEFFTFRIRAGNQRSQDWQHRPTIKIVLSLLGANSVGKTTIANCLQYGCLPDNIKNPPATIGSDVQFFYLDRLFQNEYNVIIQLNDPSGQEKFETATNHIFRQCHGTLLLADSTRMITLQRLEQYWYTKLETLGLSNVQSILVCTKIDLFEKKDEDYRHSFLEQAEKFAFLHQIPTIQVSAYRGDNVENIFKQLINRIMADETLVNDLISKASRPDDLIKRRRNSLTASNVIPLGLGDRYQQKKKKLPKCCS
jgi:small GTP-binding protein